MLLAGSALQARRTGLAGVGRVDVDDPQTGGLGLVIDKPLELSPRPAVQARPHAPTPP
jgi:hypothetical protein